MDSSVLQSPLYIKKRKTERKERCPRATIIDMGLETGLLKKKIELISGTVIENFL